MSYVNSISQSIILNNYVLKYERYQKRQYVFTSSNIFKQKNVLQTIKFELIYSYIITEFVDLSSLLSITYKYDKMLLFFDCILIDIQFHFRNSLSITK